MPASDEYLAQRLTPYPLATKDRGLLHTIDDARTYMLTLPKTRNLRTHWQHVPSAAAFARQWPGSALGSPRVHRHGRCCRQARSSSGRIRVQVDTGDP
jgi:hypothetical protein